MMAVQWPGVSHVAGSRKYKEKNKFGNFVNILYWSMICVVIGDTALALVHCLQNCEVPKHRNVEGRGFGDEVFDKMNNEKFLKEVNAHLKQRFGLEPYAAKAHQEKGCSALNDMRNGTHNWDDEEGEADSTKKQSSDIYENIVKFIERFIMDFILYEDPDAQAMLSPDDIAFIHKAMLDSVLYIPSM